MLSANGGTAGYGAGGGSGGSLWIAAPSLQGNGVVSVNGSAAGGYAGGGGGGRLYAVLSALDTGLALQSVGGGGDSGGVGGTGGSVVIVYTNAAAPSTAGISVAGGGSASAGVIHLLHDTDLDGLSDEDETAIYHTNPPAATRTATAFLTGLRSRTTRTRRTARPSARRFQGRSSTPARRRDSSM
jgi:hypothetical protein